MSSVIDNLTRHPTRRVKSISHWVLDELDANIETLIVRVKEDRNRSVHTGRFYPHARHNWVRVWKKATEDPGRIIKVKIPEGVEHLIIARIPIFYTYKNANRIKRGGPPPIDPKTWEESLVCIVAHEAQHVHQFLFPKEGRPRWSEVEAEWAEFRLLKRFRERK